MISMAFEEVGLGGDMHEWVKDEPIEGKVTEIREDVGKNKSKVYKILTREGKDIQFWGTSVLNLKLDNVVIGQKVRITLIDPEFKFPNGRIGREFKVEVDK